jgi:hypothetical protein
MITPDAQPIEELPAAERPESRSPRRRLRFLALAAMALALPWLASHLHGMRIAALSTAEAESFYPDITIPATLSAMLGFLSLVLASRRRGIGARSYGALLMPALAILSFLWLASDLIFVAPDISLGDNALSCRERVPWSAISGVELEDGGHGREYVRLELDPARVRWPSALLGRGSISCEITGQNVDYARIYDAIQDRWAAQIAGSQDVAPETVAGEIPVGTSEKDVIAAFGAPFVLRAETGDTFYYASPHGGNPRSPTDGVGGWRLVAVYFDKDGRARRVADYHRQGRKFIDATGGPPLALTDAVVVDSLFHAVSQTSN